MSDTKNKEGDGSHELVYAPIIDRFQAIRVKLPPFDNNSFIILTYMATTLFVFYACATVIAANYYTVNTVAANLFAAIVQGFAIATFVYAISHTSGGHINPAVSFALMISGNIGVIRGIFYLLGGITGAALLSGVLPGEIEGQLGTTTLGGGVSRFQGFLIEFIITFALLFTIFGTALNKEAAATGLPSLAPLPIGYSITIGVGIAYTFTGGSLNPARTFGPAVISHTWDNHYIYWAGPMGAALVIGLLERYLALFSAGQRRVIRNIMIRRAAEFQRSKKAKAAGRAASITAVPVVMTPGAMPVPMVPMVDPEHPEQAVMVPVALYGDSSSGGPPIDEEDKAAIDAILLKAARKPSVAYPFGGGSRRPSAVPSSSQPQSQRTNSTVISDPNAEVPGPRRRSVAQQDSLSVPVRSSPTMRGYSPLSHKRTRKMSLMPPDSIDHPYDEEL